MKKILIVLSLLLSIAVLCGCSSLDAAELLQGNLELVYRDNCSEDYLEAVGFTRSDATGQYEAGIEAELAVFADYFDIDLTLCSEEAKEKIRAFYRTVYSYAKYEVGQAAENDGAYTVPLTVYPIDIMQKFLALDADTFMSDWETRHKQGEFAAMTDGEYEEAWLYAILNALNPRLKDIGHLEGETVEVRFVKDESSGRYTIPEEDFARIDGLIIAY